MTAGGLIWVKSGRVKRPGIDHGRISGVYGIKGWVRIHSFTEPAENLFGYRDLAGPSRRRNWQAIEFDAASSTARD